MKTMKAIGVLAFFLVAVSSLAGCVPAHSTCYDPDTVDGEPNRDNWVEVPCS